MTESQFSSADPWGLPPDEDAGEDVVPSLEEEPADAELDGTAVSDADYAPEPAPNETADVSVPSGEVDPASDESVDQDDVLPQESELVSDEPLDVRDLPIVEGSESSPDVDESGETSIDDLHEAVAALGSLEGEAEVELQQADSTFDDSSELFVGQEPEVESPDLEALADDLASAIPVPVDEPADTAALEELSQKVSAWNEGGVTQEPEESPAQDDSAGMNYWGDETAADSDPESPLGNGDTEGLDAPQGEVEDDHLAADGVRTEPEDVPGDADGVTLSSMAIEAESVFGDEGQLGPVEELPDDLPSWAVEDRPVFGDATDEVDESPEPDLEAVKEATDQLGEPDLEISSEPETADPFAPDPAAEPQDDGDPPADLALEASVPDNDGSAAPWHEGDGNSGVEAVSEIESLQTLAEDLAAAETSQSTDEATDEANEDSTEDDAATESHIATPPAPRGALAAAAAFFSRSETSEGGEEESDDPSEESQTEEVLEIDEVDPSAELESWIEDNPQAEPEFADEEGTSEPSEAGVAGDDIADKPKDEVTSDEDEFEVVDPSASGIDSDVENSTPTDQDQADDPWATLIEEGSEPSGLDVALGDQPVPSVYSELEELPPALPLEGEGAAEEETPGPEQAEGQEAGLQTERSEDKAHPGQSGGPAFEKDDWGSLWSDSAQGWVEDSDGGSEWRTIVTTADTMATWQIDTYLGVVSGDATLGEGPADEMLPAARKAALDKMVSVAMTRAAHAVVAVSVSIATIADVTIVTSSGTAATLRTEE